MKPFIFLIAMLPLVAVGLLLIAASIIILPIAKLGEVTERACEHVFSVIENMAEIGSSE